MGKNVFPGFIYAAHICRVDKRVGSLAIGKDADIVIWNGNPLDIASSVYMTIVNGKVEWNSKDRSEHNEK